MKKVLAVAMLLVFGCLKITWGQSSTTAAVTPSAVAPTAAKKVVKEGDFQVGTKKWREAIKYAQDLKTQGKFQEAVDAAPLNIQKAWYSLNVLRQLMGGHVRKNGTWGGYKFDQETLQFTGDKDACVQQMEVIKGYCDAVSQSIYSKEVERIKAYVEQYTNWINDGLPKPTGDSSSSHESGTD